MRRAWLILGCLLLAGCSGNVNPVARAAGSWPGSFAVDMVGGRSDPSLIASKQMKANLELYVTHAKFRLDAVTSDQKFTVTGTWKAERDRITLTGDNYVFDNPKEEDIKALNLKIIPPDDIRAVFGHPVVFDESEDRRKLTGLKISFGDLVGRFEFERPIPR